MNKICPSLVNKKLNTSITLQHKDKAQGNPSIFLLVNKDQDTIYLLEGSYANCMESEASHNLEGGLGVIHWKNLRPRSSDLLKKINFCYSIQIDFRGQSALGCAHSPQKAKQPNLPKSYCRVDSITFLV